MGASIINNSESLNKYRGQIHQAIEDLKEQMKKTEQAIESVYENGWKDDNFRQFQNNFNQDKEKILPLCNVLDNYESNTLYHLQKKIESMETHDFKC